MRRAVLAGTVAYDAACLAAVSVAMIRGWSADHFASALVAIGLVSVAFTGTVFFGRGSRVGAARTRAAESTLTRERLPAGQSGHDWLEGRAAGPSPILIGAFAASVAVLSTGMLVGFFFGSS